MLVMAASKRVFGLMLDFDDPRSPVVATELVGTSVSSPGPDYDKFSQFLPANPHVKFFDSRVRGYVAVDVSPKRMDIQSVPFPMSGTPVPLLRR